MPNVENQQSDLLVSSLQKGVLTISINRPERKNAMNNAMWREMTTLFERASMDTSIRAVILKGAGDDFCAGADIAEFETLRATAESARV